MEPVTGQVKEYTFTSTQGFSNQISNNGFNRNVHMKVLSPRASTLLQQFIQFNLDRNFQRIQKSNRNARSYGKITLQFPDYSQFPQLSNESSPKNNRNRESIHAIKRDSRIIFDYLSNPSLSFKLPLTQVITLLDAIGTPYVGYEYLPQLISVQEPTQAQIAETLFDPMLKMRLGQAKKSMTNEEKKAKVQEIRERILRVLSIIDPVKSKSILMRDQIKAIISKYYPYFLTPANGNRNGKALISVIETELLKQERNQKALKDAIVAAFETSPVVRDAVSRLLSISSKTNVFVNSATILQQLSKSFPGMISAKPLIGKPLEEYINGKSPLNTQRNQNQKEQTMRAEVTEKLGDAFYNSPSLQAILAELMAISLPEDSPYQHIYEDVSRLFQPKSTNNIALSLQTPATTVNQRYIDSVYQVYDPLVALLKEGAGKPGKSQSLYQELLDILESSSSQSNGNNASTVVPTYEMEQISTFTGNRMGKLSASDFQEVIRLYTEMAKSVYQRSQGNVSTANKNALIQISSILSVANGNHTVKLAGSNSTSTLSTQSPSEYGNSNHLNLNNEGTVALGGAKRKSKQREFLKAKTVEQLRRMMRRAGKKCSRKGVALRKGQMISALMRG